MLSDKNKVDRIIRIKKRLLQGESFSFIQQEEHIGTNQLLTIRRDLKSKLKENKQDLEIIVQNIRLSKKFQKEKDINRIERKAFRLYARKENALKELDTKLISLFSKYKLPKFLYNNTKINAIKGAVGFLHLTDLHLNELVDLPTNKFDFNIASKRLKLYAIKVKDYLKVKEVKKVLIGFTGDILNSDRRLDELLSQATNRAKAIFLSVPLLAQFIADIAKDFVTSVTGVVGNESRIHNELGWTNLLATDNYDYTILNILQYLFTKSKVQFYNQGNSVEKVIDLLGQKILLIHGNQIGGSQIEQKIQMIKGKYASQGIELSFIAFGHLHSTVITDFGGRGSSLVGANAYSNSGLQLESRAAQSCHIFYANGNRDSIKVDLQNIPNNLKGYNIDKELAQYAVNKVSSKKQPQITVKITG